MKKILTILFVLTILVSCKKADDLVWKYTDGYYICDWMEFGELGLTIINDTIYSKSKHVATIIDFKNRIVDYELTILSPSGKEKGFYCSKGNKE